MNVGHVILSLILIIVVTASWINLRLLVADNNTDISYIRDDMVKLSNKLERIETKFIEMENRIDRQDERQDRQAEDIRRLNLYHLVPPPKR